MDRLNQNETFYDLVYKCFIEFTGLYETQNVMYSFANDFAFIDAYNSFEMMKEIILVFKNRTDKFEFRFSTVAEYYEAVK